MAATGRGLSPFALLRRNALYRGLLGGERKWMVIGALVWVPRIMRRLAGGGEEVVATEKLKPGQSLCLTAIPQRTRAQRRAVRRTG